MSLTFSFTFLDFLAFKHAECPLKRFKRPAAVIKTDYSRETFYTGLVKYVILETGIAKHCLGAKIVVYACL